MTLDFPLTIDHSYIWVTPNAPEMDQLRQIGLVPLPKTTTHTGQGTASWSLVFQNAYLELLWVTDESERAVALAALGGAGPKPETWRETGVSPFGIGLHYHTSDTPRLALPVQPHTAPWIPADSSLDVIPRSSLWMPSFFVLEGRLAYRQAWEDAASHPLGVEYVTGMRITVTKLDASDPISALLTEHGVVEVVAGEAPLLELTFDERRQQQSFDLRPILPLIIHC